MATEVAIFALKEGPIPDDFSGEVGQTWKSILETVLKQPGAQRAFWGSEEENASNLRLFVDWDSVDSHKTFQKSEYVGFFDRHSIFLLLQCLQAYA